MRMAPSDIRSRIPTVVAVAAAGLLGLAGCASTDTARTSPSVHQQPAAGNASMAVSGGSCPSTSTDPAVAELRAGLTRVALPPGFHAVAAVRCQSSIRAVPGSGEWQFADAQRADSELAGLLAALRLPSKTPSKTTICTAELRVPQPFALVDASGAVISPLLPHDQCGGPLPQVTDAMNALPWRTETEQRVSQVRTQAEIDTGCAGEYKYLFEHPVPGTPEPWSKVRRPGNPQPTTVCLYTIEPQSPDDYIAVGSFTHGTKLTAQQQSTIVGALAQASDTPAPACAEKATRFASLDGPYSGIQVELDGCRRIRWPNGFIDAAPAVLSQFLATLSNG